MTCKLCGQPIKAGERLYREEIGLVGADGKAEGHTPSAFAPSPASSPTGSASSAPARA